MEWVCGHAEFVGLWPSLQVRFAGNCHSSSKLEIIGSSINSYQLEKLITLSWAGLGHTNQHQHVPEKGLCKSEQWKQTPSSSPLSPQSTVASWAARATGTMADKEVNSQSSAGSVQLCCALLRCRWAG